MSITRSTDIQEPGQIALDEKYAQITADLGTDYLAFDPDKSSATLYHPGKAENLELHSLGVQGLRNQLRQRIGQLLDGKIENAIFPVEAIQCFTREEISAFETAGLVFGGISDDHLDGGIYIKHHFNSSVNPEPENLIKPSLEAISVSSILRGASGLITRPAMKAIPEDISGLKRFPMNSLVAAVHKDGKWSESQVLPDGEWIRGGYDDSASQYGQCAFEGVVATHTADKSTITIFNPEENARRFIKSCRRLGIPPISVNQFIQAVKAAVDNNRQFIPENGKLYVRPYIIGLHGGTGIQPAKQYIFGVEVSPYGNYLGAKSDGIDLEKELPGSNIKSVVFERPDFGRDKVSGNYATLLELKEKAKAEGFKDILLISNKGRIQECASNNFFLVFRGVNGVFNFHTSSLTANILPGITRKSILALLRDPAIQTRLGEKIKIFDKVVLAEAAIAKASAAFGTGTAAGISNFKSISMTDGQEITFDDPDTQLLLKKIYDLMMDLRRGKVPGYENWVMEV